MVIGLLGGTFDPIHFGHLHIAWQAHRLLQLKIVYFMPCHIPAHRDIPSTTPIQRKEMVLEAIRDIPQFALETCELDRATPSYMIDSLALLRAQHDPDTPFCLLLGSDAFSKLPTWRRWEDLLTLTHIAVFSRPGAPFEIPPPLDALYPDCVISQANKLRLRPAGYVVHLEEVFPLSISSTTIRQAFRHHHDPRFLLPDAVWRYVIDHRLYQ